MELPLLKNYTRLIYRKAFKKLSFYLVFSAILGGLYEDRLHFLFGLSFFGALSILLGWSDYLRSLGIRLPMLNRKHQRKKTPYILRRFKTQGLHKPAFLMDYNDFDDDLILKTAVSEAQFTNRQCRKANMWAKLVCGIILTVLSFIIQP